MTAGYFAAPSPDGKETLSHCEEVSQMRASCDLKEKKRDIYIYMYNGL